MQSIASTTSSRAAAEARFENEWTKPARDGFVVCIAWQCLDGGKSVSGTVRDTRGGNVRQFSLDLASAPAILRLDHDDGPEHKTFIDVTLSLVRKGDLVSLNCKLPISLNKLFDGSISDWPLAPSPSPYPDAGRDGEIVIEAPADTTDLVSFIWLRPLSDAEMADAALRFVRCQIPAMQTLYAGLDPAAKTSKATAFINSSDFVNDIGALGPTIALFPAARLAFIALPDKTTSDELIGDAEQALAIQPQSLTAFLEEPACAAALLRLWQSLFALALAGQPTQAMLSSQLLDILRVFQYLSLLTQRVDALTSAAGRQISLAAIVAMPDNVATVPPDPTIAGGDSATAPDTWEVLGVGKLKMARQRLCGYAPGELADVVNVMPRERQEMLERTVMSASEHASQAKEQFQQNDSRRETSAASELADTIHEVMAADGMGLNMTGVTPAYDNLNMLLTGSGSNSKARSGWSAADTSRMVQRLTEQAAKRLGDRISGQRGREWQALRERRQSQLIDNTGNERLVGVYRWVDRVVRVNIEELGARLVLAFDVAYPARAWVARVAAQGNMPLVEPVALPASYAAILPGNYQALGAQYGLLALEPPPPAQLILSATISRTTLGDLSLLCVPDGYAVTHAAVTVALSDNNFNLACSVCGHDLPAIPATPPAPLSVALPACATSGTGPALVDPPVQPTSVISTVNITTLPITTGRIPVTVMSAAPLFCVTVTLTCTQETPGAAAGTSLLSAWQMRVYAALQGAWQTAWNNYDAALGARIAVASAGHTGEVQRDTLKQCCLGLLLQVSGKPATSQRALEPMLDWAHMTWQYQSPTSASGDNWPQNPGSEATRPSSDRLFQRFLGGQAARVLLPVSAGWERGLLFYLQFQRLWVGGMAMAPVTDSTLPIMEELIRPEAVPGADSLEAGARGVPPRPAEHWTVRVPTSMIYLQNGADLPQMLLPIAAKPEV